MSGGGGWAPRGLGGLVRCITGVAAFATASCSGKLSQSESAEPTGAGQYRSELPPEPLDCPEDMVAVGNAFCIDRYEASRLDATEILPGRDKSRAQSREGVLPWQIGDDNAAARAACLAAGKDLCTEMQWSLACEGSRKMVYGYGNEYEPRTCNGIDLFGPGSHELLPSGALDDCHSDYGVFDINGNLWEHVLGGTGATVRGGAYDCKDSRRLHRCDYLPISWTPLSLGFRCCLAPSADDDQRERALQWLAAARKVPDARSTHEPGRRQLGHRSRHVRQRQRRTRPLAATEGSEVVTPGPYSLGGGSRIVRR